MFNSRNKFSTFANSLQEKHKSEAESKLNEPNDTVFSKKGITIKNLIETLKLKFLSGSLVKSGNFNNNQNLAKNVSKEKSNKINSINEPRKPFQFSSVFLRTGYENRFSMNQKKIKDVMDKNHFLSKLNGSNRFSYESSLSKLAPIKEHYKEHGKIGSNLITNSQLKLKNSNIASSNQRTSAIESRKSNLKLSKFKFSVKDFSTKSLGFSTDELIRGKYILFKSIY